MNTSCQHLQELLDQQVPLARAMGIKLKGYGAEGLLLTAPLARNQNYKGTAFAGSLATIATLAGWALSMLRVEEMGMQPEVVVARSTISYLRPVREDIEALCIVPDKTTVGKLHRALDRKGIGRWELTARIPATGARAVDYVGSYAITVARR